ncbi:SusC/RagA family TonB-linked outer membrane protein [Euzebyella saccharophila]|uniref:SusC/RagA family TonB-linked outer membrane protein n=1 Tax=Euzebyella saccharophila TaxID=679664 RepID=A0ABV8JIE3_9FLAO|nr:SusC/RagA family TonB-linked outer membrane protein [Euzebyella saccharophila]
MKKPMIRSLLFLFFVLSVTGVMAQREITGTVSSTDGELLPGVSVVLKGTTTGVSTDFDGNYSINVPGNDAILLFSYIGMSSKEVPVGSQNTLNVSLEPSSEALDEVVVTALGISREKKSLGYSVSEVDGDALDNVPQENALNALSGKVSGVAINSTGAPGSSVSMVIRGATSLSSDNQPLFVIDGVPVYNSLNNVGGVGRDNRVDYGNAISDINADDIETMTVLKGASAAALYGSRAGNGVVLITTKSGKAKKGMGVTINSSTVFDIPYRYLDTHTRFAAGSRPYTEDNFPSNEYGAILIGETSSAWAGPALDQGINAIHWPYTAEEIASGVPVPRELKSYDNAANFFNTAITSTNNISIQDNTERLNYRLSYTNLENKGFIPNSDLSKNSINLNSSLKLVDNITVSSSLNYTKTASDNRPAGNRGANPIQAMYELAPHIDVRDLEDYWLTDYEGLRQNSPYAFGDDPTETEWNNPYYLANEVNNSFERNRFYGNVKADWQITSELSGMVRYNFDEVNEVRETKISNGYTNEMNGAYGITDIFRNETNIDFLLTYAKKFNNWDFSASFGGNRRVNRTSQVTNSTKDRGQGLLTPNLFTLSNIAPENLNYNSYNTERQVNSLYGLANIGFMDTFFVDVTFRKDWSSTLPVGKNAYDYPSVSASLLLNNALNMGNKVSMVKLRAGYAEVGNDTDPYKLVPILNSGNSWDGGSLLSVSSNLLNPELEPEKQNSWEAGVDLAFFSNRLRFDFTYYESDNKDQIFPVNTPISSGYNSKFINAGLITSEGIEAGLNATIVSKNDWNWDMGFIFSRNRTKVMELADGMTSVTLWTDARGGAITWIGEEIGNIFDAAMVRVEDPNSPYFGWPIIDEEGFESSDRTREDEDGNRVAPIIGNFNPDFNLGMTTSASYKNWTLSMNFDWRKGGQFVSQTHRYGESDMHTQRWLDKLHNFSDVGDLPSYLKENADQYLSPDGEFYVLVGGPTAADGGFPVEEGGVTLSDGVFMPGVLGEYDENGNFVATAENLGGPGTVYTRYQDHYGWDFTRNATFDADYVKLREISLTYNVPSKSIKQIGLQNLAISLYSRNVILWTKADIGIDPEMAFQPESSEQGRSGIQFKQGIERFNVNPWAIPVGFKLSVGF